MLKSDDTPVQKVVRAMWDMDKDRVLACRSESEMVSTPTGFGYTFYDLFVAARVCGLTGLDIQH